MMLRKSIGISLIGILLSGAYVLADSTSIDNSLYQPDEQVAHFDVQNAYQTMQDLKSSVDDITEQLYALDAKERSGDTISDKYRSVREDIVSIIQSINTTTDVVREKLRKVATLQKLIQTSYQDLQDSRAGYQDTRKYIAQYADFIYRLDTKLYNDDMTINDLKLMVNSDNIPRSLANDAMVESMLTQFGTLMNNFTENETKQIALMKKLNQLKIEAQADIDTYTTELEKLQQKKNYLIQFVALYKDDKLQRQTTINMLFDSNKSVYDKITQLVREVKKWVYKVDFDMDKKMKQLAQEEDASQAYPLAWPLYPIEKILSYFWDQSFQKQYGVPHIGIQIQAKQGTPVYAARDGVVYFVADSDSIGINWAMVVHTDGYISIYEYLNKSEVQAGDIIKRGQLIGYSGGEPGTRGAGFISKWANLTFIALKDGIAMDPFDLLDSSIVKDKNILPDGYQVKYLRDKYARPIDITELKLMTGSTLLEREQQFLNTYGVGIYKMVPFWADAVKDTNIDRDVVICIAFAESTLGRYLSTAGNIGNVGNNDRGDRVPFSSAYAGARAIPLTLNNAYLGDYHTINQLSRYGNKDGKIYASSPINRQTNVLKCLSQIKGYYIPEDFPFRTGVNPNRVGTGENVSFEKTLSAEPK